LAQHSFKTRKSLQLLGCASFERQGPVGLARKEGEKGNKGWRCILWACPAFQPSFSPYSPFLLASLHRRFALNLVPARK
jgi:hypothetical protein